MFSTLSTAVSNALDSEFSVGDLDVIWERPQDAAHGDLATPMAMKVGKQLGKNPQEVAKVIAAALEKESSVESAAVAGPGFVNIFLTPEAIIAALSFTREACTARVKNNEAPIAIDYSAPNIAKPLGIHHILSTVIGQSIANINTHLGYQVVGINHLGDWGTQFGKLAVALEKWGEKSIDECTIEDLFSLYIRFHEEAEQDESLEDLARAEFKKIEDGDAQLREFWEKVVSITMEALDHLYERLHVSFEYTYGESFYEDKMQPIIEEGKEKGVFVEGEEGALIVEFSEESTMPPAIVVKADGATIYLTRDLATIHHRISTLQPQAILYIVDVAQSLYFKQLFATVEQLGWELPHLEHVVFGRMRFADQSMSTRKGNILRLEEVLDEAAQRAGDVIASHGDKIQTDDPNALAEIMGHGAVVYGVLSQNRKMDMTFDWDKALSFEGNSAPYLQYTHARARSIISKAGSVEEPENISELSEKERQLLNTLLRFDRVLEEARKSHMPHVLANYLYELCQSFNTFYNDEPILKAQEPARTLRVHLTDLTASVLKTGAHLLTISVPDRM